MRGAVEGCGVLEVLQASADGADGIDGGEGGLNGQQVRVHAVKHDGVEDLENEIHGCGVSRRGRQSLEPDWRGGRAGRKLSSSCNALDAAS